MKSPWFYRRIQSGQLGEPDLVRVPPYGNYLIRDDPPLIEQLRHDAQDWLQARAQSQS